MLFKGKKAQGISMNVIIIAAIALLVLVVLSAIFAGRMGIFSTGVRECKTNGGVCKAACEDAEQDFSAVKCPDVEGISQLCCVPG